MSFSARSPRSLHCEIRFDPGEALGTTDCPRPVRCLTSDARSKANRIEPIEAKAKCHKRMPRILIKRTHCTYLVMAQSLRRKKEPDFRQVRTATHPNSAARAGPAAMPQDEPGMSVGFNEVPDEGAIRRALGSPAGIRDRLRA